MNINTADSAASATASASSHFKLLSCSVGGEVKEEELIGVIGSSGADLVALQQCSEERCGRISTACGYEYVGNWAEPERGDGVALLSKMPLGQHDGKTSIPIGSYSYWDEVKPIRRAFVLAAYVSRFQLPLLVTQLERWSQSDDERKRQEKQVESLLKPDSSMEWLQSNQRIIVGDLDVERRWVVSCKKPLRAIRRPLIPPKLQ